MWSLLFASGPYRLRDCISEILPVMLEGEDRRGFTEKNLDHQWKFRFMILFALM